MLTVGISIAILNHLGTYEPWSPHMWAWSGNTLPLNRIHGATPAELQGAVVFQGKQCRNCHEVGGTGGQRGPALDDVANRLTYDQLVRQVLQGGGNMPAYGKNLSATEVSALVGFLETMHRPGERQAQNAELPQEAQEQGQPAYTSTTLPPQYQSQLTEPPNVAPAKPKTTGKGGCGQRKSSDYRSTRRCACPRSSAIGVSVLPQSRPVNGAALLLPPSTAHRCMPGL